MRGQCLFFFVAKSLIKQTFTSHPVREVDLQLVDFPLLIKVTHIMLTVTMMMGMVVVGDIDDGCDKMIVRGEFARRSNASKVGAK